MNYEGYFVMTVIMGEWREYENEQHGKQKHTCPITLSRTGVGPRHLGP